MASLCLVAVSEALHSVLNVAAMTALATGGVSDAIEQKRGYPFLMYAVSDSARATGLGTKPGQNLSSEVAIRLHVFSKAPGFKAAHAVMKKAIELLSVTDALRTSLASGGYTLCGGEPFYDETVPIGETVIAGEVVQELVANFRLYVEEA